MTAPRRLPSPGLLTGATGEQLGVSAWRPVTQEHVDAFAELTGDRQWIHTDPERAATGPLAGTVAHGFLLASLLPSMLDEVLAVDGYTLVLNKGVERLRFLTAVPTGARVRGRFAVDSARTRPRGFVECVYAATVELAPDTVAATAQLTYLYQT